MIDDEPAGRAAFPDGLTTAIIADTPGDLDSTMLDPVIQAHIGRELKALFDVIAHEPVPDRFVELLRRLEEKKLDQQ
jgi:hypothetical protein